MSTTVKYEGNTIATADDSTVTLETRGTWLTDNIEITDEGGSAIMNQDKTVIPTETYQEITADEGFTGLGTVTVAEIPSNYGLITWDGSTLTVS